MTIKDLPLEKKVLLIDRLILCLDYWKQNLWDFESGAIESHEYQWDIYWYEAHGIREALTILYGRSPSLDKFMTHFTAITDDMDEDYDPEELCDILRDAFGITEEEYQLSED